MLSHIIRVCSILQTQNVDFHCIIVGRGSLEQSLNNLVREMGFEKKVTLVGAQTQNWVKDRLSKSDLFVLACVNEGTGGRDGIPVAIMEAMAMAVPVISTPVSGIPELIRDEETGLLVPERNANALANAISRLASEKLLRQKIVENGLNLIAEEYDIIKNTCKLCELFESVIGERHR
jgi:colanic acid/amylovoran biosynthesis glycosyltransferase